MILAAAIGFALDRFAQIRGGLVFGVIAGLVVAQMIPSKGACSLPRRPEPSDRSGDA